jgi:Ca2+-binding RTX toxin-like protein
MPIFKGTKGNDKIIGSNRDDDIKAGDGHDEVWGRLGNDIIDGGNGNDTLYGEGGNDRLLGSGGNNLLDGGDGNDVLLTGFGSNEAKGGSGDDEIISQGLDVIVGGAGNDLLQFLDNDTVTGGLGNDLFTLKWSATYTPGGVVTINDFTVGEDKLGYHAGYDANETLAGNQGWEYIGEAPPLAPLTNGNGQATVSYEGTDTYLRLYHADGDVNADVTVRLVGTFQPNEIDLMNYNPETRAWTDPGLLFFG